MIVVFNQLGNNEFADICIFGEDEIIMDVGNLYNIIRGDRE